MAHIIVDYSANLAEKTDLEALASALHDAAVSTGIITRQALRTRLRPAQIYRIADNNPDNAYCHVMLRLAKGRDEATRQQAGRTVFEALCAVLSKIYETAPLALSVEVAEVPQETSFKKMNFEKHAQQQAQQQQ
ncbi:MAG: hypothetical protein AAGC77_14730 [Pseudomonadota bacterium]